MTFLPLICIPKCFLVSCRMQQPEEIAMGAKKENGVVISFHDVSYDVEVKVKGKCGAKTTKHVLTNVK